MANVILERFNIPSKLSTEFQTCFEKQALISEYIKKASAKAKIALSEDFLHYDDEIIHHYLWSLNDRLEIINIMFGDLMDSFFMIKNCVS